MKNTDKERFNIFLKYICIIEHDCENKLRMEKGIIDNLIHYQDDESIKMQLEFALDCITEISNPKEKEEKILLLKNFIEKLEKISIEKFKLAKNQFDASKLTQSKNEEMLRNLLENNYNESNIEEQRRKIQDEIESCQNEQVNLLLKERRTSEKMSLCEKLLTLIEERPVNLSKKGVPKNTSIYLIVAIILGTSFFLASCNHPKPLVLKNPKKQIEVIDGKKYEQVRSECLSTIAFLENLKTDNVLSKNRIKDSF